MTTFPIKNENYSKWFRKTDWFAHFVDVTTLPEKMYMVLGGKLKAVMPVATAIAVKQNGARGLYLIARVAGCAERQIISITSDWTKYYHSPEHFNAVNAGTMKPHIIKGEYLERVLNRHGVQTHSWSGDMYPLYYYWDNCECKVKSSKGGSFGAPVAVWSDEFGVNVEWAGTEEECVPSLRYNMKTKMYRTIESCLRENSVEVVEFGDEEECPEEQEWLIDLPKTIAVTAKTEEEARNIVQAAFSEIINK